MRRIIFIIILATIVGMTAMAQNRPTGTHHTSGDDRDRFSLYNDRPTLAYDNIANVIVVTGSESDFYLVNITSLSTQLLIFDTVINGDYDIIDASIMSSGNYTIALTSSHGNTYRWTFNKGLSGNLLPIADGIGKSGVIFNSFTGLDWTFPEY